MTKTCGRCRRALSPEAFTRNTWLEGAGIPRTRRKLYMGHGKTDVTDLYERHDVERFLAEDGEKLRTYLGAGPVAAGIRLA